jgi:uncharacterized protein YidB (DUF937 family)
VIATNPTGALKAVLGQLEAAVLPAVLGEVLGNGGAGGLSAIVAKLQQQLPIAVDHAGPDGRLPHTA